MKEAQIVREFIPLDEGRIHGVTFDGELVWFARDDEVVAFDPRRERVVHQFAVAGACAGTAFDGTHLYQLTREQIVVIAPQDGTIVRRMPAPPGLNSGMAWADGYLWVGHYDPSLIHKLDAKTGELLKTLRSDKLVTGVSCFEGQLWHAVSGGGAACEVRRLASDGSVEESFQVPVRHVAGIEACKEGFWCAGENGRLRLVKRPRDDSAQDR